MDARFSSYERLLVAGLRLLPPDLRGKSRFARSLLRSARDRTDVIVESRDGCKFMMPSLTEPIAFHCLIDGVYEPATFDVMRRFLPVGGVFLDVGANVGVYAVPASRIVGKAGCVVAIEASPRINPYLAQNISLNACDNMRQVARAATEHGATTVRFWPAPDDHFGMGALAPQFHATPVDVERDTIDNILASLKVASVDLVKIDIEGFEAMAFAGARDLLSRRRPTVIFEFADWAEARAGLPPGAAQRALRGLGYARYREECSTNEAGGAARSRRGQPFGNRPSLITRAP